jgi:hypothetical protein
MRRWIWAFSVLEKFAFQGAAGRAHRVEFGLVNRTKGKLEFTARRAHGARDFEAASLLPH